jgi:hypothetical protein
MHKTAMGAEGDIRFYLYAQTKLYFHVWFRQASNNFELDHWFKKDPYSSLNRNRQLFLDDAGYDMLAA